MPKQSQVKEAAQIVPNRVEELLEAVLLGLKDLKEAVQKPITSQARTLNEKLPEQINEQIKAPESSLVPVPPMYRKCVDEVLNQNFGIELENHSDAPLITFTIVVPDKYSSMTPSQREILKRDIRPKVLTITGGVPEVKEWAETVYRNFSPEMQAIIMADRIRS